MLIENLGPFADETSTAEKVAREVLGQQTYADVEKRGSRLFPERSELQRLALGTLSIDASAVDHPATNGHIELADFVEGRTGSRHPGRGRLAQQRHRSAPRNLDADHRCANIINISETDDQLTRGHRSFRSAGPAQPGFGGTLPYSTPKPRQTTILSARSPDSWPMNWLHGTPRTARPRSR